MPQPTLTTPRLRLIPLSDAHLREEADLDADPAVMRFVGEGQPRTPAEVAVAHKERMSRAGSNLGFWAGFGDTGFVGWWLLTKAEGDPRGEAELGYRLHERFWRQGLASEGAAALLEYGFRELGLRRIFASTLAVNIGSRGVMQRLGLHLTATRACSDSGGIAGAEDGDVDYAITSKQWFQTSI